MGFLAASTVVGAVFLGLLRLLDRWRLEPSRRWIWFVFASAGLGVACVVQILDFFVLTNSELSSQSVGFLACAVFVEETLTASSFIFLVTTLKSLREPLDGVIQGAALGLGFALYENFLFGSTFGWTSFLLRSWMSLPGHMAYGAVWGGFWSLGQSNSFKLFQRWFVFLLAWIVVLICHFAFDVFAGQNWPWPVPLVTDGIIWILAGLLIAMAWPEARRFFHTGLNRTV